MSVRVRACLRVSGPGMQREKKIEGKTGITNLNARPGIRWCKKLSKKEVNK